MGIEVYVRDGSGGGSTVKVTKQGQLVVAPIDYSTIYTASMTSINTAYNLVGPQERKNFIITLIYVSADKSVNATNGAIVNIYEATSSSTTTITKTIYQDELARQTRSVLAPFNIKITSGRWINAKTDSANVRVGVAGYFIDS